MASIVRSMARHQVRQGRRRPLPKVLLRRNELRRIVYSKIARRVGPELRSRLFYRALHPTKGWQKIRLG